MSDLGDVHEYLITVAGRPLRLLGPREPHALNQDPRVLARRAVDPEYHPHWALPWPVAVMLAQRVLATLSPGVGPVLEVGAGLGLAGLALAQAGFRVVITDYDEDALAFVRASAERNGLLLGAMPALKARKSVVGDPPGAMPDLEAGMSESPGMVTTRPLDWRHPPVEQFPVIIGADVAYYPEHHAPLAALLTACLAPSGDAFISEMNRRGAEPFPALLRARGFDATPYPATAAAISAPGSIDGRTLRGVVWHIRRTH